MFINRERELQVLEERYRSSQAEFFVLYGRRRVGKTELLRQFCRGKPHVFFVADLSEETWALRSFTREVSRALFNNPERLPPFENWEQAFRFLAGYAESQRLVVVLDEFPYLVDIQPALPSILQRLWDELLKHTKIMLVLSGSHIGMMEKHVLGHRAPLYGRRTAQWQLKPFAFWDAQKFFPEWSPEERVRAFAVLGGMPMYLRLFQSADGVLDGIARFILRPEGLLYDEPHFLLRQELREPGRYFAVLEALASGRTRRNEIGQRARISSQSLPFYLSKLQEMDLVEYVVPVTVRQPHKFRKGLYRLKDHFLRFWFRFVYPYRFSGTVSPEVVLNQVRQHLDEFTSWAFEDVARAAFWRLAEKDRLPWPLARVGSWWKREVEIDAVALNAEGTEALLGEAKWTRQPVDIRVVGDLQRKAENFTQDTGIRVRSLVLFSRSGFTPGVQAAAQEQGWLLVDLDTLVEL